MENERLKVENMELMKKLEFFSFKLDSMSDHDMKTFTGFSKCQLQCIFKFLNFPDDTDKTLTTEFKLYIFFVKMKTGVSEDLLSVMFKLSKSTISRLIVMLTNIIYEKICRINIWPTKEQVQHFMPFVFKANFPNCRVIIDST
jgi:hypothetical protein